MRPLSRRLFTPETVTGGLACSLIPCRVMGANDRMQVGLTGCGIKECARLQSFDTLNDASIIAVSNPDKNRMDYPGEQAVLSIFGPSYWCRLSST